MMKTNSKMFEVFQIANVTEWGQSTVQDHPEGMVFLKIMMERAKVSQISKVLSMLSI